MWIKCKHTHESTCCNRVYCTVMIHPIQCAWHMVPRYCHWLYSANALGVESFLVASFCSSCVHLSVLTTSYNTEFLVSYVITAVCYQCTTKIGTVWRGGTRGWKWNDFISKHYENFWTAQRQYRNKFRVQFFPF